MPPPWRPPYATDKTSKLKKLQEEMNGLLADTLSRVDAVIEEESSHRWLKTTCQWSYNGQYFGMHTGCGRCQRRWSFSGRIEEMEKYDSMNDYCLEEIIPHLNRIIEAECFGVHQRAELAEWITRHIERHGGVMAYDRFICDACDVNDLSLETVHTQTVKMGFLAVWLPKEHPLHPVQSGVNSGLRS